jgi:hypothetical protein
VENLYLVGNIFGGKFIFDGKHIWWETYLLGNKNIFVEKYIWWDIYILWEIYLVGNIFGGKYIWYRHIWCRHGAIQVPG